jgi:hypothetical protein
MHGMNGLYFLPFLIIRDLIDSVKKWFSQWFEQKKTVKPVEKKDTTSLIYLETTYEEKCKDKFLKTYEKEGTNFSVNIDPEFYDKKLLSSILEDVDNHLEKKWKTRMLIEHTPRGNVIMYYDAFKQAFAYYSDQAAMPYHVINAVAMKYVTTFLCRDFFLDDGVVPKDKISRLTPKEEPKPAISTTTTTIQSKSPFIKPKNYHAVSGKTELSKKVQEKVTNRFVHLGKIRNLTIMQKAVRPNANNGFQTSLLPETKLSYEEYKKLKQKNT